jgi:hypothetical protein
MGRHSEETTHQDCVAAAEQTMSAHPEPSFVTAANVHEDEKVGVEVHTPGRRKSSRRKRPNVRVTGPEWVEYITRCRG